MKNKANLIFFWLNMCLSLMFFVMCGFLISDMWGTAEIENPTKGDALAYALMPFIIVFVLLIAVCFLMVGVAFLKEWSSRWGLQLLIFGLLFYVLIT